MSQTYVFLDKEFRAFSLRLLSFVTKIGLQFFDHCNKHFFFEIYNSHDLLLNCIFLQVASSEWKDLNLFFTFVFLHFLWSSLFHILESSTIL